MQYVNQSVFVLVHIMFARKVLSYIMWKKIRNTTTVVKKIVFVFKLETAGLLHFEYDLLLNNSHLHIYMILRWLSALYAP